MPSLPDFGALDLTTMNETDVKEEIVRPLLRALGFRQSGQAYITTERTLTYDAAFLGRKDPKKDPPLRGRADYECGLTSYGRWVLEAKAPSVSLTREEAEQAHTYAAHPQVAASHYVVTNGHEFRVYQTSYPDDPVYAWALSDTHRLFDIIENILGPEAIRKRAKAQAVDIGKPLAKGFGSKIKIVGGIVDYSDYKSSSPVIAAQLQKVMGGHRATLTDGHLVRTDGGLLSANLQIASHFAVLDQINRAAGIEGYTFESADPYVSKDRESPTVFQNLVAAKIEKGTSIPAVGGLFPQSRLPFGVEVLAGTFAAGFIDGDEHFRGVFDIRYKMRLTDVSGLPVEIRNNLQAAINSELSTEGTFDLRFSEA